MKPLDDLIGAPVDRVDGRLKVTGQAPYAAEYALPGLCHAVLVTSTIAQGHIARIDDQAARAVSGVLAILTPANALRLPHGGDAGVEPPTTRKLSLLQDDAVHYNGQAIAVVVAESLEAAQQAARLLTVEYRLSPARLDFAAAKQMQRKPASLNGKDPDSSRGDLARGLAQAAVQIDQVYGTPKEFHNPMEPHATIALWQGERLKLYDSTQAVVGLQHAAAKVFGLLPEQVETVCRYTGGGFGSKGSMWSHVILAAMAAKTVQRPVKLVLQRDQMFYAVGFRPQTEQHLLLAADASARLTAVRHDTISATSTIEDWAESSGLLTRMLYDCAHVATSHRLVQLDTGTPTFMRAPGESSGSFALETAMDELAVLQGTDPLQLRLTNYAERDGDDNKPFSEKYLRECYTQAAERFGWSRRQATPRALRVGHRLVGLGMATATYPANRKPSKALARINSDGRVVVQSATQDLGTGTYTIMTQVAAQTLGFALHQVRFELGESGFPEAPVSGGSVTAGSVGPAVQAACLALRAQLIAAAVNDPQSVLYGMKPDQIDIQDGWLVDREDALRRDRAAELIARRHGEPMQAEGSAEASPEQAQYSTHSFGAVFAEVHVDQDLGTIQVERITAAYNVGRLMNQKTARSQLLGGIVWGLGMALMEAGEMDPRIGRIVNNNLAEYHVPVNADIRNIEVIVVPGNDTRFNPLGARGIGEIGITGVAAAIGNAIYNATGQRIRQLPITLDKLI